MVVKHPPSDERIADKVAPPGHMSGAIPLLPLCELSLCIASSTETNPAMQAGAKRASVTETLFELAGLEQDAQPE
jgi:hypothetical protein